MSKKSGISAALCIAGLVAGVAIAEQGGVQQIDSGAHRTPLRTVVPEYPKIARRDRIEGTVQVCFGITRKGLPRRIAVRNSTNRVFERPSISAIKRSRWVPLAKEETPPAIKTCRTFTFSLVPVETDAGQS